MKQIQVTYDDWHVGDGDKPIVVGRPWNVTLEAKPAHETTTPYDWHPRLCGSGEQLTGLWPVEGEPAQHQLVGDVVSFADHEHGGPWVLLEAGGWRVAAPGRHEGRVSGEVILNHDTYMIDDGGLRTSATQQVEVLAIAHVAGRYRSTSRWRDFEHIGWEQPRTVTSTHALGASPAAVPGLFVITCRLPDPS